MNKIWSFNTQFFSDNQPIEKVETKYQVLMGNWGEMYAFSVSQNYIYILLITKKNSPIKFNHKDYKICPFLGLHQKFEKKTWKYFQRAGQIQGS